MRNRSRTTSAWFAATAAVVSMLTTTAHAAPAVMFDSGPTTGTETGHSILAGAFVLSEHFVPTLGAKAGSVRIGLWLDPGVSITALNWSIGTRLFGTELASGAATSFVTTALGPAPANPKYALGDELFAIGGVDLLAGTDYTITISATTSDGSTVFWDGHAASPGVSRLRRVADGAEFAEGLHAFTVFAEDVPGTVEEPAAAALTALSLLAAMAGSRAGRRRAEPVCPHNR